MNPITEVTPGRKVKFQAGGKWHVGEVQTCDGREVIADEYTHSILVKLEPNGRLAGVFPEILQDRDMRKEGE